MDIDKVVQIVNDNKVVIAAVSPLVLQLTSWLIKKSPWMWDDTLLGWIIKNKAGIKQAADAIRKSKKG